MVLWGGLLPIPNQLLLDVATVVGWCLASGMLSSPSQRRRQDDEDDASSKTNKTTTATSNSSNKYVNSTQLLLASCLLTLSTSGLTNRWPLTIVMIPLWICHGLQRLLLARRERMQHAPAILKWAFRLLQLFGFLWIAAGAALAILFPAVQLPAVDASAPFDVGFVDFYVPIYNNTAAPSLSIEYYVPSRLWYPTPKPPTKFSRVFRHRGVPYLDPDTALDYCQQSMRLGSPPPLKQFGWMLHTWRLIALPVSEQVASVFASENDNRNGSCNWCEHSSSLFASTARSSIPPDDNKDSNATTAATSIPLIFYSHGLGGSLNIYSYQAMELAAHGALVVSFTHADGSAPVAVTQPSETGVAGRQFHDHDIIELWNSNRTVEYARARRQRTDQRTREFLAATDFVHEQLKLGVTDNDSATCSAESGKDNNNKNDNIDYTRSDTLRNLLQPLASQGVTPITMFMGHSFGGASAWTAAHRRPNLAKAVIAHEPATGWIPDDARRSLFAPSRLDGLQQTYDGGTGGYQRKQPEDAPTLHDHVDVLVMHSNEWMDIGEGNCRLLQEMAQQNRLGRRHHSIRNNKGNSTSSFFSISRHAVVAGSHHTEFSDTSMLTPLWLARAVNMTGPRNPIRTAREIASETRDFVRDAVAVAAAGAGPASTTS